MQIKGADQLGDLAKRLRAQGDSGKGLKKELVSSINRATKPVRADAKRAAKDRLPQRGGLAALVARAPMRTKTATGRNPGVSIVTKGDAVRSTDRGMVRHPVFNTGAWVRQPVPPGWFTDTMRRSSPLVRHEVLRAMRVVAQRIARH
jgi:hypothetical protein